MLGSSLQIITAKFLLCRAAKKVLSPALAGPIVNDKVSVDVEL